MFLKKIVSSGFKSFADRVVLTLDKTHITGIVGPNGSGKSNVIDAVRWVMGEQNTKMLRGEKATDIIFAGSEKRKPLGMAEVSLVFDNEEPSEFCPPEYRHEGEITLTRRLYIDGQREYLINRKPVRLKDIVSFFTSTGLGGRSYSMIQQGQVDRILQAKPEQLREMLEEAAGTLIFKTRRQEAVKKLERTAQNMARLDDICGELERQIQSLEAQVKKAEEWQQLTEELKSREISLFVHNYRHFGNKKQDLKKQIEDNALKKVACLGEIARLEVKNDELKKLLDEADPELHALNEEIALIREKIASSEASLHSATQLLENGGEQLKQLEQELEEESQNFERLQKDSKEAESRLNAAESEKELLEESLADLEMQSEMADEEEQVYQGRLNEMKEEKHNIERLLDNHKIRRENLEKEFSNASRQMNEFTEKVLALEEELSQEKIVYEGQQLKLATRKKGVDQEVTRRAALTGDLEKNQEKLQNIRKKLDKVKSSWFEKKATLGSLQEIARNTGGWMGKVQELKDQDDERDWLLLTDALRVRTAFHELPDPAKTAFEGWSERLIARDQEHLSVLAGECRNQETGGIPVSLTGPVNLEIPEGFSGSKGLIPFSEFVEVEEGWPEAAGILSRIYYCSDEGLAALSGEGVPAGLTLVTEQGICFQSEYDGTIGRSGGPEGALARKEKIEELGRLVDALEDQTRQGEENLEKGTARGETLQSEIRELEDTIGQKNQALLELMSEFKGRESTISHKEEQIVVVRKQYLELEEICEKHGGEIEDLRQSREALTGEKVQLEEALEDAESRSGEIRDQQAEVRRQCEQKRIDLASAKTLSETLREHFTRDQGQAEQFSARVEKKKLSLVQLQEKIADSERIEKELTEDIEKYIFQREELEESLNKKKDANAGILEDLRQTEALLKEARDLQQKAQKSLSEQELELERIRLGMEGIRQQALEKYQTDPGESEAEDDPDFSPDKAGKQVSSLRSRLDNFGPVNMMAVEEYRELQERQGFLTAQKNELTSAINLLELAIDEIEETSRNRFIKTFTTLNEEFSSLFPILFPRGEGKIQMTEPENPLESGVEIMVRLPGKKQQNMRLFSGGEKALTAIALIFALLKSKPTPFCFLDEVDAPLDETNVGRYNRVLEALADRFQFIVITHRRKTMEVLDTLYGVTMQEPGVSKVVGVDMSKALPAHLQKSFKDDKRKGATASP